MFVDNHDNKNSTSELINSKNKSKLSSSKVFSNPRTKNPVDDLVLKEDFQTLSDTREMQYKNFKFVLLIFLLVTFSLILNPFFSQEFEPQVLKLFSLPFSKPYILTSGEFKTFAMAKQKAIKLLPELKQVNINQLKNGTFTFEIEKFSSKEKAYKESVKLKQDGFESVHVRYLPD